MSVKSDIPERLIYTCNCGWVDKSHADPVSKRPFFGAISLWTQILKETGKKSKLQPGTSVIYAQDASKLGITVAAKKEYFIASGLTVKQKEAIALAIFQDVSRAFEGKQAAPPIGWFSNSGFSSEDLVSNLLGFYSAVRGFQWEKECQPTTKSVSEAMWDKFGSVGDTKNFSFTPILYPCTWCEASGPLVPPAQVSGVFPAALTEIVPAKMNPLFRYWTVGPSGVGRSFDEYLDLDEIAPSAAM